MANCRPRWRCSWIAPAAILAASLLAFCTQAPAEVVLDEFTDSAVGQISWGSGNYVESVGVGDLSSKRQIRIAAGGNNVAGAFDINVTVPGILSAQIGDIQRNGQGTPLTAVQFNYYFAPTDITEGGRNNAILFDFAELRGQIQPTFLRAWVFDDSHVRDSFIYELRPLVENLSPHTLAAPFDKFTSRGGAPRRPDPTTLKTIFFDFYFIGHTGELNWSAQLERIRFGVAPVPEPSTAALIWTGLLPWLWRRRYARKECARCYSSIGSQFGSHCCRYGRRIKPSLHSNSTWEVRSSVESGSKTAPQLVERISLRWTIKVP